MRPENQFKLLVPPEVDYNISSCDRAFQPAINWHRFLVRGLALYLVFTISVKKIYYFIEFNAYLKYNKIARPRKVGVHF